MLHMLDTPSRLAPAALVTLALAGVASAQITVPAGFSAELVFPQVGAATPRLEAISNPAYGAGVMTASIDSGILKVIRIREHNIDLVASLAGFPPDWIARDIRFDTTGLFGYRLYVSASTSGSMGQSSSTELYCVEPGGALSLVATVGSLTDSITAVIDFTDASGGFVSGCYLEDGDGTHGTEFGFVLPPPSPGCGAGVYTTLLENHVPPGRTDLDVVGMKFDRSGLFAGKLLLADTDINTNQKTAIYALAPNLTWTTIFGPVSTNTRRYRDMDVGTIGTFGAGGPIGPIYVTETLSQQVQEVDSTGLHETFASGFTGIESIAVSSDGESLYVSDTNGVYRIRAAACASGPVLLARSPQVEADDEHSGPSGIPSIKLIFSEPIVFEDADVTVVNSANQPVALSVSGSGSQFLLITLGVPLRNDTYDITVADSVLSVIGDLPIDGDLDGCSGGPLAFSMRHRVCKSLQPR